MKNICMNEVCTRDGQHPSSEGQTDFDLVINEHHTE